MKRVQKMTIHLDDPSRQGGCADLHVERSDACPYRAQCCFCLIRLTDVAFLGQCGWPSHDTEGVAGPSPLSKITSPSSASAMCPRARVPLGVSDQDEAHLESRRWPQGQSGAMKTDRSQGTKSRGLQNCQRHLPDNFVRHSIRVDHRRASKSSSLFPQPFMSKGALLCDDRSWQ